MISSSLEPTFKAAQHIVASMTSYKRDRNISTYSVEMTSVYL